MNKLFLLSVLCLFSVNSQSCSKSAWSASTSKYPFTLMPLPYAYSFFEPYISAAITTAHHDHHHQSYVTNLNAYLSQTQSLQNYTLLQLVQNSGADASLQKYANGDFNHNMLWWQLTSPKCASPKPKGKLGSRIDAAFGSFANFQSQFQTASAGLFGSGWAWLCQDPNKNLIITTTAGQLNPLRTKTCNPILASDLWEHSYYLQYLYNKDAYFANFWKVIDWDLVEYFFDRYVSLGNPIPF